MGNDRANTDERNQACEILHKLTNGFCGKTTTNAVQIPYFFALGNIRANHKGTLYPALDAAFRRCQLANDFWHGPCYMMYDGKQKRRDGNGDKMENIGTALLNIALGLGTVYATVMIIFVVFATTNTGRRY
jgi:hypothetical protein